MGLFVSPDGHYRGWLAGLLCCCAAVTEDENSTEGGVSRPSPRGVLCHEQPLPLTLLPSIPSKTHTHVAQSDAPHTLRDDLLHTAPGQLERPPSLKPLDLGDSSLFGRPSRHGRQASSSSHSMRPSISAPHAFRRLEYTDGQRTSLVPLKLAPVRLTESPAPLANLPIVEEPSDSLHDRSGSGEELLAEIIQDSYRLQRESPFQRCRKRASTSTPQSQTQVQRTPSDRSHSSIAPSLERTGSRGSVSRQSSGGSLRRQAIDTRASSVGSRPSIERTRPQRKRSAQSIRRHLVENNDADIDKEILELNTIVEERRLETIRSQTADQHIAAVAPSMRVRARSETLNDIGSAFARPYTAGGTATCSSHAVEISARPNRSTTARTPSHPSSRVSGWLSAVLLSAPFHSASTTLQTREPFYKCIPPSRPRTCSEISGSTSLTELESPSLTAASSPTSRAHSRSLTAESRLTTLSPPSTVYSHDDSHYRKEVEENWPIVEVSRSQVGLAF
ncbi:MAG: hypothetical protein FE78DRAFT_32747 [Acidomyces sp. 'richmondensis']|nr:MAG: hypothetical protein FE78DRAFT_32747 [Acidomyces sp. 'richmondensis']